VPRTYGRIRARRRRRAPLQRAPPRSGRVHRSLKTASGCYPSLPCHPLRPASAPKLVRLCTWLSLRRWFRKATVHRPLSARRGALPHGPRAAGRGPACARHCRPAARACAWPLPLQQARSRATRAPSAGAPPAPPTARQSPAARAGRAARPPAWPSARRPLRHRPQAAVGAAAARAHAARRAPRPRRLRHCLQACAAHRRGRRRRTRPGPGMPRGRAHPAPPTREMRSPRARPRRAQACRCAGGSRPQNARPRPPPPQRAPSPETTGCPPRAAPRPAPAAAAQRVASAPAAARATLTPGPGPAPRAAAVARGGQARRGGAGCAPPWQTSWVPESRPQSQEQGVGCPQRALSATLRSLRRAPWQVPRWPAPQHIWPPWAARRRRPPASRPQPDRALRPEHDQAPRREWRP